MTAGFRELFGPPEAASQHIYSLTTLRSAVLQAPEALLTSALRPKMMEDGRTDGWTEGGPLLREMNAPFPLLLIAEENQASGAAIPAQTADFTAADSTREP